MGTIARRLGVLVAIGALVATGCAKDETVSSTATSTPVTARSDGSGGTTTTDDTDAGGSSGEYDEACGLIGEIDDLADEDDLESALPLMEDARDASPDELQDHWAVLIGVFDQLVGLTPDEAGATMFELMGDPEFLEAAATIDDFAEEECGLDIDLDPAEDSGSGSTDDTIGGTGDDEEDPNSIDALQAHLEAEYSSEAWWPVIDDANGWGRSGFSGQASWTITLSGSDATAATPVSDLVAACDAMAAYLDEVESGDVTIEIDDNDNTALVTREPGEDCQPA